MPEPTPAEDLVNDVGPADAVKVANTNFKQAFLRGRKVTGKGKSPTQVRERDQDRG